MTWLYILLGIILFIVLLLLIPVGVKAEFKDSLKVALKIGFVSVQLYPPKPKKPKKEKKRPKEEKEEKEKEPKEKKPSIIKEKGIMWLVDFIKEAASLAADALKSFFSHVVIKRLNLSISYHGEDASDTAVKYGYLCLSVYPAVSILVKAAKCRNYGVDISPDFSENGESKCDADIYARTRIVWLFAIVFRYGFKALKLLLKLRGGKNTETTQQDNENEPNTNTFNKGEFNMDHPIGNLMNITMEKIKEMVDVNTIVGTPITSADGTLIIPVSKVSYGFASGGSDLPTKNPQNNKDLFGGGSGAGVTIQPVAFLTVYQGNVRLISVGTGDGIEKLLCMVPDVVDKVKGIFKKDKSTDIEPADDFSEITVDDVDL